MATRSVPGQLAGRQARPSNRRDLIMDAAADLFHRNGYAAVGMGDIAQAVGVRPSALYRHFAGKQELLKRTVEHCLEPIRTTLAERDTMDIQRLLRALATIALDRHQLGSLWHRETRNLPATEREELRAQVRRYADAFQRILCDAKPSLRPDAARLRVWCVFGVLLSTSNHDIELSRPDYDELLCELASFVVDYEQDGEPASGALDRTSPGLRPRSRRERLINAATGLFAEHGYAAVGMEDIGAAVRIAGPSVYNHFTNKADLLSAIVTRGVEWLHITMTTALGTTNDPAEALHAMLESYVELAYRQHALIDVVLAETDHLPEAERRRAKMAQSEYIEEWVHLVQKTRAQPRNIARTRVHAVLTMINDVARTPALRDKQATRHTVYGISSRLLQLPARRGDTTGR